MTTTALTPQRVELVKESFAKITARPGETAALFYARLFETAPQLRPLFRGNPKAQGRKLMFAIGLAVGNLENLPDLIPFVQNLGRRHAAYGVSEEDYGPVGEALLWTLDRGLGADFTPEVQDAWRSVYGLLADTMKSAGQQADT